MEKFYVGLDVGTNSCGIAATDEDYKLLRFKGKDMWSVRLFDEAQTAEGRRFKRTARRRLVRRKERIRLLQSLFAEEMAKVDNTFFIKLNNSPFFVEDKDESINTWYNLFCDEGYTDREYYSQFPTIYHLRQALLEAPPTDVRFLYLAMHHMIKYRGHFLFEGQSFSEANNVKKMFEKLNDLLSENYTEANLGLSFDNPTDFEEIVKNNKIKMRDKVNKCCDFFNAKKPQQKEIITAIIGGSVQFAKLFGKEEYKENTISKFSFKNDKFEEKAEQLSAELGDDFEIFETLKAIYDWGVLRKILGEEQCVSNAMVKLYDKHKADLKALKAIVKKYFNNKYFEIFRSTKEKRNYSNYIGYATMRNKKKFVKKCAPDEFMTYLKGILTTDDVKIKSDKYYIEIINELEDGTFLPKILNADNGVFPYQLNEMEMKIILSQAAKKYEFLNDESDGMTVSDKILKLLTFKIPYYAGPLSKGKTGNAWIVKNSDERITPWNFDKIVNLEASNENFMRRMTNKCTYIPGADVLPKCSLMYSTYDVLNQLNKLKVNEQPITVEMKQTIFNELFKNEKKVTDSKIKKFLVLRGFAVKEKDIVLTGKDEDFNANMGSYIVLKSILGQEFVDSRPDICERIILLHTLFTDKNMLAKALLKEFNEIAEIKANINRLRGLNFKDFGRFSKEFLTEFYGGDNEVTGEKYTILSELFATNYNLMELLNSDKYTFKANLAELNVSKGKTIEYADVDELYISPMVKRGVWQSIKMVDEYVKAVGKEPNKIFVEVTRSEQEKKKTVSRLKRIQDLYKKCKELSKDISHLTEELNSKTEADLRQDKLYLYFTQLGRCMYSNEPINLEDLAGEAYDIDHIIPQALLKDDSLNNRVLAKRELNKQKTDMYPLPPEFVAKNEKFWNQLKENELIDGAKFARLTRKTQLTQDEQAEFINRQLVSTNQAAKAVAELLSRKYPDTKIVYSKASNVSDFRHKYKMLKNRDINDVHHAKDAYLNVVVGNVFDTKYSNVRNYVYEKYGQTRVYKDDKLFERNVTNAWQADDNKTISDVKNIMAKNSALFTKLAAIYKGEFYNQTVYTQDAAMFPLKEKGPMSNLKYGGYNNLKIAYFMLVKSLDKKGNEKLTIEGVPVIFDYKYKGDLCKLRQMCKEYLGLVEPQIIVPIIRVQSLLSYDGSLVRLAAKSGDSIVVHLASQWLVDENTSNYCRLITEFTKRVEANEINYEKLKRDSYEFPKPKKSDRQALITKSENIRFYYLIISQLEKKLYIGLQSVKSVKESLSEQKEKFESLDIYLQSKQLINLVKGLECNAIYFNTKDLTGTSGSQLRINKNITGHSVELINESVGGLYQNRTILSKE